MKILRNRLFGKDNVLIASFNYANDNELHGCHISKEAINNILQVGEFTKRADECPDKSILSKKGVTTATVNLNGFKGSYAVDVIHIPVATESEAIDAILWAANQDGCRVRMEDDNKPTFTAPEDMPDTAETKALLPVCFADSFQKTIVVDELKNILEFDNRGNELSRCVPVDELPDELKSLDFVRTPEVKQAYQDSLPKPEPVVVQDEVVSVSFVPVSEL